MLFLKIIRNRKTHRKVRDGKGSRFRENSSFHGPIHTVKPLEVDIPKGKLTVVTGVSGSGKTTLILESLVPGLSAASSREKSAGAWYGLWTRPESGR